MDEKKPSRLKKRNTLRRIGWREWVSLPELGLDQIKAKVDTGARTSALHAFSLQVFNEAGQDKVRFDIHPIQHNVEHVVSCVADIIDKRWVTDSGGHREERYVICTPILIAGFQYPIEITLTERDSMLFRMLLGRSAIKQRYLVNPGRSFLKSKK